VRSYSKFRENKHPLGKGGGLTAITVHARPGLASRGLLRAAGHVFPCALGKGGIKALKREGDGGTPLGRMKLIKGYYRHGRLASLRSGIQLSRIGPDDGWCDDPGDRNYNRAVRLPCAASHERMMRFDRLYDCCIVLDYNLRPRRRGAGSAIFFHIAHPDFRPTEGCIAVSPQVMARLLPRLSTRTVLIVER
jgi:L,D-peptidoglycan transpeptidase YkuD (ErfK/YbiS/YcfS/YnhG family)